MKMRESQSELWLPLPPPVVMREGTLINISLRVRGLPLCWRTRINVRQPPHRFAVSKAIQT
jgi:hypothetical protein